MKNSDFDVKKEYQIIKNYEKLKSQLMSTDIKEFNSINIGNLIGSELHKFFLKTRLERIKRFVSYLICEKIDVFLTKKGRDPYTFGEVIDNATIRKDNELIKNNVKKFLEDYNEITVVRINKIKISKLFVSLKMYFKFLKEIKSINSLEQRLYSASLLAMAFDVLTKLESNEVLTHTKLLTVFQDHEFLTNAMVQIAKKNGGVTVTLQHGQNFYRRIFPDHLGIENFTSNYRLNWNKFTQIQFMKAGFQVERLPIVGSTKYIEGTKIKTKKENGIFGVVLDTPTYDFNKKNNLFLLSCAEKLSKEMSISYYIKSHPTDHIEFYQDYLKLGNCKEIVDLKMPMEEFCLKIDFVLMCGSGAIVDIYIANVVAFIFKSKIPVPIETDPFYFFENENELIVKVEKWERNRASYAENFKKIREMYYVDNPGDLHKQFFDNIKKESRGE